MAVYALAGRRPDPEGTETIRFPLANRDMVAERIGQLFSRNNTTTLVASAACGADLIALQVAGRLNLKRHIVLPFSVARFRETSVTDRPGDWGSLYDSIIAEVEADSGLMILDLEAGSDDAYRKANDAMIDLAAKLSNEEDPPRICIVWEGSEREGDISNQLADSGRARGWPVDEVLTV